MTTQPIPLLPIPVPDSFQIIAHRGASAYAPENTQAAFALAERMGISAVELDTQLTTDGVVALCHDRTLARYGHGDRVVEEMAWPDLAALDMGSWFSPFLYRGEQMLRLDQLFEQFGDRLTYHVELKGRAAGLPAAVHSTIEHFGLADSCVITSFSYDSLVAMRQQAPALRLGWLIREVDAEVAAQARALDLFQLCPAAERVTAAMVAEARVVVAEVRAWGLLGASVSRQAAEVTGLIRRVLDAGCDGMTINWPDWVVHGDRE